MSELDAIFPSIKVHSFPKIIFLDKRGMRLGAHDNPYIVSTEAFIECPKCLCIDDFYASKKFASHYCRGNLPVEVECRSPLTGNKHTHQVICAGIAQEHFHIECSVCDFTFFVAVPNKENLNG